MQNRSLSNNHYFIDFWGCDTEQIESIDFWKETLFNAANEGELEVIDSLFHKFEPQGFTALLLLATSHLSIHTWPEDKYVACDLFSCSGEKNAEKAVEYLLKKIKHNKYKLKKAIRN
ncbi:MAG: adenosylmethionine decarboxylase [Candidatus Gastranaerophilales bacterium]|nr:adenosylmethionine decarboxylase [Candidatus Gastranaerophilales bacterium]